MVRTTVITGIVLILLGLGFYFGLMAVSAEKISPTALAPAAPGVLLVALGGLASARPSWRMHVMHLALLLGLLIVLGGLGMGLPKLPALLTGGEVERPIAAIEQLLMGLVGLVFVALGVKSFIDARRARNSDRPSSQNTPPT